MKPCATRMGWELVTGHASSAGNLDRESLTVNRESTSHRATTNRAECFAPLSTDHPDWPPIHLPAILSTHSRYVGCPPIGGTANGNRLSLSDGR